MTSYSSRDLLCNLVFLLLLLTQLMANYKVLLHEIVISSWLLVKLSRQYSQSKKNLRRYPWPGAPRNARGISFPRDSEKIENRMMLIDGLSTVSIEHFWILVIKKLKQIGSMKIILVNFTNVCIGNCMHQMFHEFHYVILKRSHADRIVRV